MAENALLAVSACVALAGLLGMLASLLATLRERRREMAILRSVGARPRSIFALLLSEALLLTLLGILGGLLLLYGGQWLLADWLARDFGLHLAWRLPSAWQLVAARSPCSGPACSRAACRHSPPTATLSPTVSASEADDAAPLRPALSLLLAARRRRRPPRELDWLEMMPKDEVEALMKEPVIDHSGLARPEQTGSFRTIPELDGQLVRLPGYIVPIDTNENGELTEFFLVPYFGACIHVPPPPPNQIVLVRPERPIPMTDIWEAYWVEGTLKVETQRNDIAASAYTMSARSVTIYQ
ncbi:MAG: DUF3299 domain-containing protein [Xanthomonadales bacterium]|nr:DUF3299 domain-containing protein [Xanthomonadales bacterium]